MRNKASVCLFGVVAIFIAQATANAGLMKATGSWVANNISGQGFTNQDFVGSAEFLVDTSALTGVGFEILTGPLTAFSQSPATIGSTTFDLSNTGYYTFFQDGSIFQVNIGEGVGSSIAGVTSNKDDFHVKDWTIGTDNFNLSVATEVGILTGQPVTVNFTFEEFSFPVPEPSTLTLATLGFLAVLKRRRRP